MTPQEMREGAPTPSLDEMTQGLLSFSNEMDRQARPRFDDLLQRIARQLLSDDAAAQAAIDSGGFRVGDTTLVVRFNDETHQIELFADIGLPQPYAQGQAHRLALEHNLCRTYPGVTLGVHPESSRLVATTSLHLLMVSDESMCLDAMEVLAQAAADLVGQFELVGE
jgi:hypothetical protein